MYFFAELCLDFLAIMTTMLCEDDGQLIAKQHFDETSYMLFRPLNLSAALYPELLPGEILFFIQDAVGLYLDRTGSTLKIPNIYHSSESIAFYSF